MFYKLYGTIITVFMLSVVGCASAQPMDQTKDLAAMTKYEADTCEQPRVGTSKECHDKFQAAIEATDKAYKTRAKEDWAKLVRMVHDLRVQYTMAQKPPR
jgi:hypothetical protein